MVHYKNHNIDYVACPLHSMAGARWILSCRFQGMIYVLELSLKLKKRLAVFRKNERNKLGSTGAGVGYMQLGAVFCSS